MTEDKNNSAESNDSPKIQQRADESVTEDKNTSTEPNKSPDTQQKTDGRVTKDKNASTEPNKSPKTQPKGAGSMTEDKNDSAEPSRFPRFNVIGIVVIVAVAAVLAGIGIYALTNQGSQPQTNTPPVEEPGKTLLTIHAGGQTYDYTLKDLTAYTSTSGLGSYINNAGTVTGPNNYTGVPMYVLLSTIPSLPANYTLHAVASDGYTQDYTLNTINGQLTAYNRAGEEIGTGALTMIVAYKENGALLDETTDGPLRIAFVYPASIITASSFWLSSLTDLEIT